MKWERVEENLRLKTVPNSTINNKSNLNRVSVIIRFSNIFLILHRIKPTAHRSNNVGLLTKVSTLRFGTGDLPDSEPNPE